MEDTTSTSETGSSARDARDLYLNSDPVEGRATVTAVMTSFNKIEDVRANLDSQREQTVKFDEIIVVDNHSGDGTPEMIRGEYPEVTLIEMPDSNHGACETFNIGFEKAGTDHVAIFDDDIVLPAEWVEKMLAKVKTEPETTAFISSRVIEPEMPEWFLNHPSVTTERFMSTFRGCATLARRDVLKKAGYYDERLFIYGNERDLSCRVMNLGYRILQYPEVAVRHGTPFGMKRSARSLYYHVRNLWFYLFKYVGWIDLFRFVMGQASGALLPTRRSGEEDVKADAVGAIGVRETIRETPGGLWIVFKATMAAFWNLPYCLKRRNVCRHPDHALPNK